MLEMLIRKKFCDSKALQGVTGDVKIKSRGHEEILRTGDQ